MAKIQFSLIKKKIGRPEHSLTPHPLRSITSHFCLTHPLKVKVICVSPFSRTTKNLQSIISKYINLLKTDVIPIKTYHSSASECLSQIVLPGMI